MLCAYQMVTHNFLSKNRKNTFSSVQLDAPSYQLQVNITIYVYTNKQSCTMSPPVQYLWQKIQMLFNSECVLHTYVNGRWASDINTQLSDLYTLYINNNDMFPLQKVSIIYPGIPFIRLISPLTWFNQSPPRLTSLQSGDRILCSANQTQNELGIHVRLSGEHTFPRGE